MTAFYSPLLPTGILWTTLGLIALYWVDKVKEI
jgi:hypothetical protein